MLGVRGSDVRLSSSNVLQHTLDPMKLTSRSIGPCSTIYIFLYRFYIKAFLQ